MSVLAEIFAPLIPAIITGGLILGFRNCMLSFALCMLIAIVVPFVLTVAIGKKKGVA